MEVTRVSDISYDEFAEKHLSKNLPCLFDAKFTRNWRSRVEWVDKNGKPCLQFLKVLFGEAVVPVADCNQVEFNSHPKLSMSFSDFIDYWEGKKENLPDTRNLYLKDWHFCKDFPNYNAYENPPLFQADWLNEFWDYWTDNKEDYRFVYMGPKGTWTPFHADVFRSYSWSANICGHKKWILYSPGCEEHLKDKKGNLVFDLRSSEIHNPQKFPDYLKAAQPLVVHQKEGEIIFIPSCWYHQVINMEDTISINHNWINGHGVVNSWQHLKNELKLVKYSIRDCQEMDEWNKQCQAILLANCGMDFEIFCKLISWISYHRVCILRTLYQQKFSFEDDYAQLLSLIAATDINLSTKEEINSTKKIMKDEQYAYLTSSNCLFDLRRITELLKQFVLHEDVEMKLRTQSSHLLKYLIDILNQFLI